ncbi:cell division protein FtsK [Spirochaetia bacterium]|nr:cell division protein FtsK [Spirochaetia bacterium]
MPLNPFLSRTDRRYRIAAVAGALFLSALALLLSFSIAGSLFDLPFIARALGNFFVRSYGVLAFLIPAYLVWAAFILADPVYRPDRIFVLSAAIAPFMTLAIGIGLTWNFNYQADHISIFRKVGKNSLSFFIIILTFVEGLVIKAFLPLIFPVKKPRAGRPEAAPFPSRAAEAVNLYASAAAGAYDDIPAIARTGVIIDFPEPKPLGSAQAFREMEETAENYRDDPEALDELDEANPFDEAPDYSGEDFDEAEDLEESEDFDETEDLDGSEYLDEFADDDEYPGEAEDFDEDILAKLDPLQNDGLPEPSDEEPEVPDVPAVSRRGSGPVLSEILPAELFGAPPEQRTVRPRIRRPAPSHFPVQPAAEISAEAAPEVPCGNSAGTSARPAEKKSVKRGAAYQVPVDGILTQYPDGQYWIIDDTTKEAAVILKKTLEEFHIQAEVTGIRKGPVITMFEILPAPGVKLSKIVNLQDNIALRLAASSVRIVAPIPGKHAVGIEVPNRKRNIVSFREIIEGELQREHAKEGKRLEIPVVLGKDITGEGQTLDLTQTPHLLIAGSTGSGKSVCVNSMILSILYQRSPAECKLILIDPKIVELKLYNDIPHLLTPVITEPKKAFQALQYCIFEMERRYACLDSMGVRDIKSYNKRIKERGIATEHMPYIVVVIDEFADLMATTGKELESTVARLAAMSRAVGIHLVLATQRPSIDVITGLIKANIPSRIAFMVAGKMDSRIIIDQVGAEKLLGKGDMLYAGVVDPFPVRIQGAFVSDEEVERVVEHVKTLGEPDYIDDEIFFDDDDEAEPSLFVDGDDPLYEKALEIVTQQGKASASYIQRRLKIGYNRAARLVEEMEHHGVVGPAQGSKPRELLRAV